MRRFRSFPDNPILAPTSALPPRFLLTAHNISYQPVRTTDTLPDMAEGMLTVGEGPALREQRGLFDLLAQAAALAGWS